MLMLTGGRSFWTGGGGSAEKEVRATAHVGVAYGTVGKLARTGTKARNSVS
jgi:hypothetical protein